jgi:hypothetical protein
MKNVLLFVLALGMRSMLFGQENVDAYIKEAQDYLAKQDYKAAQLSLQDAINEINLLVAEQIARLLPDEINGLKADGDESTSTGAMGMLGGGVSIEKSYSNPAKREQVAEIVIVANSPMLSSLSMFLNNPAMMGDDYKSARVGTQRAILKSEMEDFYVADGEPSIQIRVTEIQIPLSQTLITFTLEGFASEADELAFAGKIDMAKLKVALGE